MSKPAVIFIENLDDVESEYEIGDAIVCNIAGCIARGIHIARVIALARNAYLIVQFHDRPYREIVNESKVVRYVWP